MLNARNNPRLLKSLVLALASSAMATGIAAIPAKAQPAAGAPSQAAFLTDLAGDYETASTRRLSPEARPQRSRGQARIIPVLGGRFLLEENAGGEGGGAYQGVRLYGFNEATGTFEASWIYTQSPAILLMRASRRSEASALRFEGAFPAGGGRDAPVRANLRRTADGFVVELLGTAPNGAEFTVVETVYARQPTARAGAAGLPRLQGAVGRWTAEIEYPGGGGRRRGTATLDVTPLETGSGFAFQYQAIRNGRPFSVIETYELTGGVVVQNHLSSAEGTRMTLRGGIGTADNVVRASGYLENGGRMLPIETTLQLADSRTLQIEWHVAGTNGARERLVRIMARRADRAR